MESKGVQYSIAQAKGRWHWMVYLRSGSKTGSARFRRSRFSDAQCNQKICRGTEEENSVWSGDQTER